MVAVVAATEEASEVEAALVVEEDLQEEAEVEEVDSQGEEHQGVVVHRADEVVVVVARQGVEEVHLEEEEVALVEVLGVGAM